MKITIEIRGTDEGIGSSDLGSILQRAAEMFERDETAGPGEYMEIVTQSGHLTTVVWEEGGE